MYRNRTCLVVPAALMILLAGMVVQAEGAVEVNGRLDDWGITLGTNGHLIYDLKYGDTYHDSEPSWWNPPQVTEGTVKITNGRRVSYQMEDYRDSSNNYFVGPQYGGQNYDAEFLGVAIESGYLHIALATGQRPDNNLYFFAPGDILIKDTAGVVYGIEVGGWYDKGGLRWDKDDLVITEGELGTTYTLSPSGFTMSVAPLSTQVTGSVWKTDGTSDWIYGKPVTTVPTQLSVSATAMKVGDADFFYNFSSNPTDPANRYWHAFIELSVALTVFDDDVAYVRWGPSCGNDELIVTPPHVPEPASFLVWAVLALAFGGCSWRRWRRGKAAQ